MGIEKYAYNLITGPIFLTPFLQQLDIISPPFQGFSPLIMRLIPHTGHTGAVPMS